MESLYLSARIITPICAAVLLGYALRRLKLWDDHTVSQVNTICFKVLFPIHLFISVIHTDLSSTLDEKLLVAGVVCVFVIFFGTLGGCIIFVKEKRRLGALVQGIFRGNTLLFGLPLVTTLYGDERAGVAALMIAVVIPVYNTLAVILLESCRGGRASLKKVLYGIVTNPLIVGTVTGLAGLLCGVYLPAIADEAVMSITKITTPLALLGLGGTFRFDAVGHNLRALFWAVFSRLVLIPAILMPVVIALGFREVTLAALLTILVVPTAVNSFTMAQQMDSDAELSGQIVVFTSLFSILSVFGWIFLLSHLGYL